MLAFIKSANPHDRTQAFGSLARLKLERAMGLEPTTFCLGSRCSTTELRPLIFYGTSAVHSSLSPFAAEAL